MATHPTADTPIEPAADSAPAVYEQPLSERLRTFLRLEFLYHQLNFNLGQTSEWATRAALANMLDIVAILGRGDVRGDVLKELERQMALFDRYQNVPGIDDTRLKRVLRNLQELRQRLFAVGPQYLQPLRDSEFLAAVKHRSAIPGGTCEFDVPDLSFWLRRPFEQRHGDMDRWMQNLRPLCDGIAELLWLLRESGHSSEKVAVNGVYQHGPVGDGGVGLIRITLGPETGVYPEISGSHHRFTVRFMQWPDPLKRPAQHTRDVRFRLTIC
jgi:cell division protein ZapD